MSREQTYEVFRFIDYGAQCRQSLDCVEGSLLIYYLKEYPRVEKRCLFDWFGQLCHLLEQYQRCKRGQPYRYLNPYSILVDGKARLLLLDLESPENEEAVKCMQLRSVSSRFVKPVLERRGSIPVSADIYCLGKTMQFILAYTQATPSLTRREERTLERVIEKCTGEAGKNFETFQQVQKSLPVYKTREADGREQRSKITLLPGKKAGFAVVGITALVLCALAVSVFVLTDQSEVYGEAKGYGDTTEDSLAGQTVHSGTDSAVSPDTGKTADEPTDDEKSSEEKNSEGETAEGQTGETGLDITEAERLTESLREGLLLNTSSGNQEVIVRGKEMEAEILRCLSAAYEREEMDTEAAYAYGRLCEIEEQPERIEMAGIKKMKLEAEQGLYAQAVLTGEALLQKIGKSEEVEGLVEEYRAAQEKESGGGKDEK